jgi:hypothetical protein
MTIPGRSLFPQPDPHIVENLLRWGIMSLGKAEAAICPSSCIQRIYSR